MLSPPVPFALVKSPPWHMNPGMTRWKHDPSNARFAVLSDARVADAERPEVLRRPRHVVPVQAELDAPGALAVDVDLEEDLVRDGDVPGLGEVGLEQELPRVVRVLLLEDERQEIVILVPVTTVEIDAAGERALERGRVEARDEDADAVGEEFHVDVLALRPRGEGDGHRHVDGPGGGRPGDAGNVGRRHQERRRAGGGARGAGAEAAARRRGAARGGGEPAAGRRKREGARRERHRRGGGGGATRSTNAADGRREDETSLEGFREPSSGRDDLTWPHFSKTPARPGDE